MEIIALLGLTFGCLALGYLLLVSLYRKHIRPLLLRKLPPKSRPPSMSPEIIALILSCDTPLLRRHSPESALWLSQLLDTLFHHTRGTTAIRRSLLFDKLSEALVDTRRRGLGQWVGEARLVDLEVGETLPRVERVRLVGEGDERLPITLAFEVDYDGGLCGTAFFDTVFGIRVWLTAHLQRIDGTMYIMFQGKEVHICFSSLRELRIKARATIGAMEWQGINWLFGRYLLPWVLKRKFLLPNMNSKWWLDRPPKPFYPWDVEVVADPDLMYKER